MNTVVKTYLFIYIGTIFYVIASYFHLSIKKWNLKQAYLIAIPLVMVEYYFSLNGNLISSTVFNVFNLLGGKLSNGTKYKVFVFINRYRL